MTISEKIFQTYLEMELTKVRIDELKRSKGYINNPTYYNGRLRALETSYEKLKTIIEGKSVQPESKRFVLEISVPSGQKLNFSKPEAKEKITQFLEREGLLIIED